MKPLGDGFIKLVKMLIAPIVFTTVVVGIAQMGAMKDVGRIGLRALVYFEVVSTLALGIGLVVVNAAAAGRRHRLRSGDGRRRRRRRLHDRRRSSCSTDRFPAQHHPGHRRRRVRARRRAAGAAVRRALRPGAAAGWAARGAGWSSILAAASDALFDVVGMIMRLAPIGAFGAMAFTVGRYGVGIARLARPADGRRLLHLRAVRLRRARARSPRPPASALIKFLRYIGEEILIVLGTSSSESALPRLMAKLEHLGLREAGRRPGRADRLLVQPRRHVDLHDDGGDLRRAGERRRPVARPGAGHARACCC